MGKSTKHKSKDPKQNKETESTSKETTKTKQREINQENNLYSVKSCKEVTITNYYKPEPQIEVNIRLNNYFTTINPKNSPSKLKTNKGSIN